MAAMVCFGTARRGQVSSGMAGKASSVMVGCGTVRNGAAGKASQGNVRCCGASSGVAGKVSRGNVWAVCRGKAGLVGRGVTRQGKAG